MAKDAVDGVERDAWFDEDDVRGGSGPAVVAGARRERKEGG